MLAWGPAEDELSDDLVELRRWRTADKEAIIENLADGEISRWVPPIPFPYTEANADAFLSFGDQELRAGTGFHLAITRPETQSLVGGVALTNVDSVNSSGSVGYWVAVHAQGRGIATRAVRLVVGWAFRVHNLQRVWLTADVDNVASRRVAEKMGFVLEGILRSHVQTRFGRRDSALYSVLKQEWSE